MMNKKPQSTLWLCAISVVLVTTPSPATTTPANPPPSTPTTATPTAIPTATAEKQGPKMMYSLDLKKDTKKWGVGSRSATGSVFIMELVSEGQSIESWNELLTNMVVLGQDMGSYVARWQQLLMEKMPGLYMDEEILPDKSMIVRYRSADERGVWRFVQGVDGVYALCYISKSKEQPDDRMTFWENLIKSSPLIANAKM